MLWSVPVALALAGSVSAHTSAFIKGMYCEGGPDPNNYNSNSNTVVNPLFDLPKEQWWMQADRGCDKVPPPDGASMALPAGGKVTVELAHNQAQTTLSYNGQYVSDWPDGGDHPEDWAGAGSPPGCLADDGALHTQNQSMAAGTALAISYESDISKVTMENLVVFTTLEHTPWKRLATYEIPADLPECPPGGCYCAWLWIPNGCGTANMYMSNIACHVTGSTSTKKLAVAKPPVYCADDSSKCVKGAKQMLAWHQATGNNVEVPNGASPAYGPNMGWSNGAQNDIFVDGDDTTEPAASSSVAAASTAVAAVSTAASADATAASTETTNSVAPVVESSAAASEVPTSVAPVVESSAAASVEPASSAAPAEESDTSVPIATPSTVVPVPTTFATVAVPTGSAQPASTTSTSTRSACKSKTRTRRPRTTTPA